MTNANSTAKRESLAGVTGSATPRAERWTELQVSSTPQTAQQSLKHCCKYSSCPWNNTHFPQKHWQKLFSYLSAQIMLRQDTEKQQNPPSKVAQALWIRAMLEPKRTLLMSKSSQTINTQVSVYLSHVAKIQLHGHSSTFWMKLKYSFIIAYRLLNWACTPQQKWIRNAKSRAVTTELKHTWAKRNSLSPMTSSARAAPALPQGSQLPSFCFQLTPSPLAVFSFPSCCYLQAEL